MMPGSLLSALRMASKCCSRGIAIFPCFRNFPRAIRLTLPGLFEHRCLTLRRGTIHSSLERCLAMKKKQKLELTWTGKDNRSKLEPRILLEDGEKSHHATHRVAENDIFDNLRGQPVGTKGPDYGRKVLADLSGRLGREFGCGYSVDNLEGFRQFYLEYPHLISETTPRNFNLPAISETVSRKSDETE